MKKVIMQYSELEKYLLTKYDHFTKKENGYYLIYNSKFHGRNKHMDKKTKCGVFSVLAEKEIVQPVHQHATIEEDGIIIRDRKLSDRGKIRCCYGYSDLNGNIIAQCKYQMVKRVGVFVIARTFDGNYELINVQNKKMVCSDDTKLIKKINDDLLLVSCYNMKYLFRITDGTPIAYEYFYGRKLSQTLHFERCKFSGPNNERLILENERHYGVINAKTGQQILPCIYDSVLEQQNHIRTIERGYHGLHNKSTGEVIIPNNFDRIKETNHYYITEKHNMYGAYLKDDNGGKAKVVVPNNAKEIDIIDEGMIVKKEKNGNLLCGFYNNTGNIIIPVEKPKLKLEQMLQEMGITLKRPGFDYVVLYNNFLFTHKNGKNGVLRAANDREILKCKYDQILLIDQGFVVCEGNRWGFISLNGMRVVDSEHDIQKLYEILQSKNLLSENQNKTK